MSFRHRQENIAGGYIAAGIQDLELAAPLAKLLSANSTCVVYETC